MKKHIVFSFGILICLLFGITTTMFAQNQRTTNEYYPTDGPIQIIKSSASTVYGEGTQITMSLDFSDDTAFGIVGKKYQVSVYETKNSKKINSGDFTLNASKVLSGTMTGLVPETDYTLFIKPYINSVATDAKMSIAVRTNKPSTIIKSFSYGKTITDSKTTITLFATYEGVPEGAVVTFAITNEDTTKNKVDLPPKNTISITPTTKQYTLEDIYTNENAGKVTSVTVTLKNKEGLVFTQTKTVPDILNGQQTSTNNKTLASNDDYQFLTKLPGFNMASLCKEKDAQGNCLVYNFNEYLQALIKLTYSLIALVAVFQIMYYGAKTMWSVTPFGKAESKDRIMNAIMGIVIALGSYLILYTINPKLVTIHLGAPKVDLQNNGPDLFKSIEAYSTTTPDSATKQKLDNLARYDSFYGWPVGGSTEVSQKIHYSRGNESIDIIASNRQDGAPILASADGTIDRTLFTTGCIAGNTACGGGYGNFLEINHPNGTKTAYAHMKQIMVTAGQVVKKGDQIGIMGITGLTTGPHLHFEVIGSHIPLGFLNK